MESLLRSLRGLFVSTAAPAGDDDGVAVGGSANGSGGSTSTIIPHFRQTQDWDCGVACAQMILAGVGRRSMDSEVIKGAIGTTSVWSVDVALFLHRSRVRLLLCTQTVGVEPSFKTMDFYTKDWEQDLRRVASLFRTSRDEGMPIAQTSLSLQQLRALLALPGCIVVVLLNSRDAGWPKRVSGSGDSLGRTSATTSGSESSSADRGYRGHYVILVKSCERRKTFFLQDPAQEEGMVEVSFEVLERARRSPGTDEDLIIVDIEASCSESDLRSEIRHLVTRASGFS